MKISQLVKNLDYISLEGSDKDISKLCYSTSEIEKDSLFFCIVGLNVDGHSFVEKAIEGGATTLVVSKDIKVNDDITVIKVKDTREAMSIISSNFYNTPHEYMDVIGITGTNGKTTSTFMIKSILESVKRKPSLIGTIYNIVGDEKVEAKRTTPESRDLQKLFREMVDKKSDSCIMEVSSHSLDLKRVYGVKFKVGIFTNLTQDHLDYHENMENYFNAKMKLFESCEYASINIDDKYGKKAYEKLSKILGEKTLTYGLSEESDVYASNIVIDSDGAKFTVNYRDKSEEIILHIPGKFNVYNALGCITAGICLGIDLKDIKIGLDNLKAVPGRSEKVVSKKGFTIIIDYAHTPDGLENILETTKEYTKGRLISLFGCGGDRDKTKRPLMGKVSGEIADFCIVTSDNPRTEDPKKIIDDILPGVKETNCEYVIIENRKEAIKYAIKNAKKDDVIVIAGKGHETYQILKDETIHFDEKEIVLEFLKDEK